MKVVIMAGGSGSRLWPVSRSDFPKQFINFFGGKSLVQNTIDRYKSIVGKENIHMNTKESYRAHIMNQLGMCSIDQCIIEPSDRGTLAALALSIKFLTNHGVGEDEVLMFAPADHIISPVEKLEEYMNIAEEEAKKGNIILFGVRPTKPETGYGYIQVGEGVGEGNGVLDVEGFKEKPDFETAQSYLMDGHYYWNSGMFAATIKTFKEEIEKHIPDLYEILEKNYVEFFEGFKNIEKNTVDYAILEKTNKAKVVPMDIIWSDVGSWDSIYENSDKDELGNSVKGDVYMENTKNSLVWTEQKNRLVAVNGLEDMLVVDTLDALYITPKGNSQEIKKVIDSLKKMDRKEIMENTTTYRFWGFYTILEEGEGYKIKRLTVNPGETLSLQMHHHRSEHWVVVKGTAEVTCYPENETLKPTKLISNESIYIPATYVHRLANPGKEVLEIIEVQVGTYLEEDDIVRFEDIYGRVQ